MHSSRRAFLRTLGAGAALRFAGSGPLGAVASSALFEPARHDASEGQTLLNSNENAYGPPPKAVAMLQAALGQANRYPFPRYGELAEEIAALHKVQPNQIVLGCGSTEILRMAAMALLDSGKQLIQPSPTFEAIQEYAQSVGAAVRSVPLDHQYAHDLGAMMPLAQERPSLIYICNPNNPTASLTPRKDLEVFISHLPASAHVLVDEAYHHFATQSAIYESFIDNPIADDRVIVCRTFSKVYGLAGLRLGYSVATPAISEKLRRYATQDNVNGAVLAAAVAALHDKQSLAAAVKRNADHRQEFFNQAMARMLKPIDSQTNFVMMNTQRPAEKVIGHFEQHNILIGRKFPPMNTYVRISLGKPNEMHEFWRVWDLLGGAGMKMNM